MSANDSPENELDYHLPTLNSGADVTLPFHELDDDAFDMYVEASPFVELKTRGL